MKKLLFLFLFLFGLFSLNVSAKLFYHVQDNDPEIIVAVKQRDMEKLEELINDNVNLEENGPINETALCWAFYFVWLEGAEKLIEAGANIYHENEDTNLWHLLMLSGQADDTEKGRQDALELYNILKRNNVKIKSFGCESLEEMEECSDINPKLTKRFFSDIRFKKGFWWLYRFGYRPFIKITDIAVWMEENFGKED